MTAAAVESPAPARYVTADSELRFIGDEAWHRGPTTGGAWTRVPLDALLAVAVYVEKAA